MESIITSGLRVLLADNDLTSLSNLQKMLQRCDSCVYKVTTCSSAQEALRLLQEKKEFDLVLCDLDIPDLDIFNFLTQVAVEMDLPVIMMSNDGETSKVMKVIEHGACQYLPKPRRTREIRDIWQHVIRKRMQNGGQTLVEKAPLEENAIEAVEQSDNSAISTRKRKETDSSNSSKEDADPSSSTKKRVVWTSDLHSKFLAAVTQIGLDKVGPKKILDLMEVEWLTRENVASHLQKYRMGLTRLQKEKEQNSEMLNGMNHSDHLSLQDHQNFMNQNSLIIQQPDQSFSIPTQQHMHIAQNVCSPMSYNQSMVQLNPEKQEFMATHFLTEQHQLGNLQRSRRAGIILSTGNQFPSPTNQADIDLSYGNAALNALNYVQPHPTNYPNNNPSMGIMKNHGLVQNSYDLDCSNMRNLPMGLKPSCEEQHGGMYQYTFDYYPVTPTAEAEQGLYNA